MVDSMAERAVVVVDVTDEYDNDEEQVDDTALEKARIGTRREEEARMVNASAIEDTFICSTPASSERSKIMRRRRGGSAGRENDLVLNSPHRYPRRLPCCLLIADDDVHRRCRRRRASPLIIS